MPEQNKLPTLVMKFGGTSVGTAEAMSQAVQIVQNSRQDWPRLIVVTSALSGVTNLLLDSAHQSARGQVHQLYEAENRLRITHDAIADRLIQDLARSAQVKQEIGHLIAEFSNLCRAMAVLGEATPRALDAVASLGERMSVRLLSAALEAAGVPAQSVEATQLIVTDRAFQNAHPDLKATQERTRRVLEPILAQGRVPVVTGFLGATPEGITTTLGRGGSDYSAGILGAVLPADEVWIWTDVDGVMSADPRAVPNAATIPELTYREIAELAYYGAKVLHPKTIRPVIDAGVGLRICNTFNPQHPGTRLVADSAERSRGEIKAVTAIRNQRLITIEGRGMLGVPGVAARAFGAVASTGTSVPLITQASSEQSICFAVPASSNGEVIQALEAAFAIELAQHDIDRIWATEDVTILTVVGAGMIRTPGIAGRVFSALGQRNVNVIAIAQGSSEVSISLVVDASDADLALGALHELIVTTNTGGAQ
ncbi:MAG: aspartate kinase [Anaerolineales bacterium]|nr:aspartate kinase [Anaerolineales bacterium]